MSSMNDNINNLMDMYSGEPEPEPVPEPEQPQEPQKQSKSARKSKGKDSHRLASFYVSAEDLELYKAYCRFTGTTFSRMAGTVIDDYVRNQIEGFSSEQKRAFKQLHKL